MNGKRQNGQGRNYYDEIHKANAFLVLSPAFFHRFFPGSEQLNNLIILYQRRAVLTR